MKKETTTRNEDYGFWGTFIRNTLETPINGLGVEKAWDMALKALKQHAGWKAGMCRDFLDNRWGRHLADEVSGKLQNEVPRTYKAKVCAILPEWDRVFKEFARDYSPAHYE